MGEIPATASNTPGSAADMDKQAIRTWHRGERPAPMFNYIVHDDGIHVILALLVQRQP